MFKSNNQSKSGITNFLLRVLYFSRNSQAGTTLAMGVCLGVIVLGATAMALANAGKEKTNTTSNEMTKQAMAVAETGVSRLQNLFVAEPRLAMADKSQWTTIVNAGTNGFYTQLNTVTGSQGGGSTCGGGGGGQDTPTNAQIIINKLQGEVVKVPSNNLSITPGTNDWVSLSSNRQYRLVAFNYDNTTNEATLGIQGKVGGSSKAQVEVKFDVTDSSGDPVEVGGGPPGLWAQHFGNLNSDIHAHVLDSSDCLYPTSNNNYLGAQTGGNYTPANQNALLPPLTGNGSITREKVGFPTLPNNGVYSPPPSNSTNPRINYISSAISNTTTFPRVNDKDSTGGTYTTGANTAGKTYYYRLQGGINMSGTKTITLGRSGKEKIVIYSDGAIGFSGQAKMGPYKSTSNEYTKVTFFLNNNMTLAGNGVSSPKVGDYQFYVYGARSLSVSGNGDFTGFIFAPESSMTLNGSGNSSEILSGAVWVKQYNTSGNHANFKQRITNTDLPDLEVNPVKNGKPTLGSISSWQRQAAN